VSLFNSSDPAIAAAHAKVLRTLANIETEYGAVFKVRGRYWIRKEPFDAWVLKGERLEGAAQPEPLRVVKKEVA